MQPSIPLSVYVHIPWCVRKCPYCDFNSHAITGEIPEIFYVERLIEDLNHDLARLSSRPLVSIFFGGGTPSLFSGSSIEKILQTIHDKLSFSPDIEITLEANPGTIDESRFLDFKKAGINRLSLGIQSLNNQKLQALGRIHDKENALRAIDQAIHAGFDNFNLDFMHGLPDQTVEEALYDLEKGLQFSPPHLSWYQLTIEPNTYFFRHTPTLPSEEILWNIIMQGQEKIKNAGLTQYEISAYCKPNLYSRHNKNYWEFGDYVGIGAGAHGKITDVEKNSITRYAKVKHPKDYLDPNKPFISTQKIINEKELIFEFMLNALRLTQGVPSSLFTERTGLSLSSLEPHLSIARKNGLLVDDPHRLCTTPLGQRFLNDVVSLFL